MKISRKHLRQLIESTLLEQDNEVQDFEDFEVSLDIEGRAVVLIVRKTPDDKVKFTLRIDGEEVVRETETGSTVMLFDTFKHSSGLLFAALKGIEGDVDGGSNKLRRNILSAMRELLRDEDIKALDDNKLINYLRNMSRRFFLPNYNDFVSKVLKKQQ